MSESIISNLANLLRRAQGRIDQETGQDIDIGDLVVDLRKGFEKLEAENERLKSILEGSGEYLKEGETIAQCLERNRRDAANARLAESKLRPYAERYRWAIDHPKEFYNICQDSLMSNVKESIAIDAAMGDTNGT